jgi:hypothetical protein
MQELGIVAVAEAATSAASAASRADLAKSASSATVEFAGFLTAGTSAGERSRPGTFSLPTTTAASCSSWFGFPRGLDEGMFEMLGTFATFGFDA